MSVLDVSCAIETAPPAHSIATNRRRVSSPRAANTGAHPGSAALAGVGLFPVDALALRGMPFDVVQLGFPAAAVHAEGFQAARRRNLVEAGFDHLEQGPF